jgi:hypothetical protein
MSCDRSSDRHNFDAADKNARLQAGRFCYDGLAQGRLSRGEARILIANLLRFLPGDLLSPDLRPSGFRRSRNSGSNSGRHCSFAVRVI